MNDKEAIARLKQGDITALEPLVRQYQVKAVRAAYLITHDRSLAEDIVQGAYLRVFENIAQYDEERPFGPWFLRIVVNGALKAVAHNSKTLSLDYTSGDNSLSLGQLLIDPASELIEMIARAETQRLVWEALEQLSSSQRAAVVYHYFLRLSDSDQADTLGIPPATIRWRLHAARERLRSLLSGLSPD